MSRAKMNSCHSFVPNGNVFVVFQTTFFFFSFFLSIDNNTLNIIGCQLNRSVYLPREMNNCFDLLLNDYCTNDADRPMKTVQWDIFIRYNKSNAN